MVSLRTQIQVSAWSGFKKGLRSTIWICEIVLPISLAIALVQWMGWLDNLDSVLAPLMNWINLPSQAALPIITGILTNIYAVIALLSVLPFSPEQATLIAIFSLISHNMIAEGIIQHKSGLNFFAASAVRICLAALTVFVVSQFFHNTTHSIAVSAAAVVRSPFWQFLGDWALSTLYLFLKILGLIVLIMVLLEFSRARGWIDKSIRFLRPLAKIMGISENTMVMWITANVFGLLYGGAIIVEEAKRGNLSREKLTSLHISIGAHHSTIEDPILFLLLGLNAFWLWIPRLIAVIIAVQAYNGLRWLRYRIFRARAESVDL